jgi:WD40 repeat protein
VFGEDRHAGGDMRCHLNSVAISPDGKTLAFGGTEQVVRRGDLATGKPLPALSWKVRSPEDDAYSLAFSPDGKVLALAGRAGIVLLDVAGRAEPRTLECPDLTLTQVAFSPDGALLATSGDNNGGVVRLWKVATGQLVFTARPPAIAWCVAFSPDGKTLAAGLDSGEVRLWDVASGAEVASLPGMGGQVRWVGFHPAGESLAAAGGFPGNVVYVWDLATRTVQHRLSGHGSGVLSGAWRADGRLLFTAGGIDGTVRVWDLTGERPRSRALAVIPPDVPYLHSIALSPEGRHLAVCNPNGTVYVLRLAQRGEVLEVPLDGSK